ncbi:MAG: hypothetical protein A2Y33_10725 [Spirochaetes bacterium GWF1_51_8]|nr:MAG: hypothetical protein A2Y33_10725 [Spirochaetes bacterium GWF1_51_8]
MKKKILLINPHIEDFAAYDHFSKPLGLMLLASCLKEKFDLRFINALDRTHPALNGMRFHENGTGHFNRVFIPKPPKVADIPRRFKRYGLPDEVFTAELRKTGFRPDYIFVTTVMTYWYTGVRHTIALLRKVFGGIPVIAGGVYSSLMPAHSANASGADKVVGSQRLDAVLSEVSRLTGEELTLPVDPVPDYSLLGEYYYAPVYTSLGCIYRCDYCASAVLNTFTRFRPESAAETILALRKNYGVRYFAFYDDALLIDAEKHIDIVLDTLARAGFDGNFYTPNGLHIRHLTETTARLMKRTGFRDIRLSLESNDPAFQQSRGAKTTNREFENSVDILIRSGFRRESIQVYTLLNTPGQNADRIDETMRYINSCGAVPRLAYFSPIPGTPDFALAEKITPLGDPLSHNNTVYLYRSGFDRELLERLRQMELNYRRMSETEA